MTNLYRGTLDPDTKLVVVIMAGGSGTRFWPLSRRSKPKQFLNLIDGEKSLLQLTAERVESLPIKTSVMVASGESHIDLVEKHLPQAAILAEPCARNTAACIAYAAARIEKEIGGCCMLCLPADHVIENIERFHQVVLSAVASVSNASYLATIGLTPDRPETGYGYIKCGAEIKGSDTPVAPRPVDNFVEKPDRATAENYLASGDYFWNSGMFVWRTGTLLSSLKQYFPSLHQGIQEMFAKQGSEAELDRAVRELFPKLDSESIDTGLMERADNVLMFPGEGLGWSDVGSWDAWAETADDSIKDESGNICSGSVKLLESTGCSVYSQGKLVAGVGLQDLIIVDTEDALLVCPADRAQDVKKIIQSLEKDGRTNLL